MRIAVLNSNHPRSGERVLTFSDYSRVFHGNIGNAYIFHALRCLLQNPRQQVHNYVQNIWLDEASESGNDTLNQQFDICILILQDQLRREWPEESFINAYKHIQGISIPLVVVSLGVNTVTNETYEQIDNAFSEGQRRFFDLLFKKALAIGVRGHHTDQFLKNSGLEKHKPIGCPAFFENCGSFHLARRKFGEIIATGLFSNAKPATFIMQDETAEIKNALDGDAYSIRRFGGYPGFDAYFEKAVKNKRVKVFRSVLSWKAYIARTGRIAAGSRVHGGVIAINAGVPAVVTSGDMRSEEMCGLMGIPYYKGICGLDLDLVAELARYPIKTMTEIYFERFEIFRGFFKDMDIDVNIRKPLGLPSLLLPCTVRARSVRT